LLETYTKAWSTQSVLKRIEVLGRKRVFLESQDQSTFKQQLGLYRQEIEAGRGAVLVGVCRGKLSEGIDFSDDAARCVIVFGIPYPNYVDPKVTLRRHYLDTKGASGQQWYGMEAARTVNQAIGRVIRHRRDYGVIILADQRYMQQRGQLSAWLRDKVQVAEDLQGQYGLIAGFHERVTAMNLVKDTAAVRTLPAPSSFIVEAVKTEKPLSKQQTDTVEIRNKVNIADDIKAMLKTVVDPQYTLPAPKPPSTI